MRKLNLILPGLVSAIGVALSGQGLRADVFEATAVDSAWVVPAGPRPGSEGKEFFNLEGPANGDFASFGVLDFDSNDLGIDPSLVRIRRLCLCLVQVNGALTMGGPLHLFVTEDTSSSIQADDSRLAYDFSDDMGLNDQLAPLHELGVVTFEPIQTGYVDWFWFDIEPDLDDYLTYQIHCGCPIRLVICVCPCPRPPPPWWDMTVATYAGVINPQFAAPQLQLEVEFE